MSTPSDPAEKDQSQKDQSKDLIDIPGPSSNEPPLNPTESVSSLRIATKELFSYTTDAGWDRYTARLDWHLRRNFKIILFIFVLGINVFWTVEIVRMLWHSGMVGSSFALSNSVLIALVSTSIANFLGLVVIVARHLFPADSPK